MGGKGQHGATLMLSTATHIPVHRLASGTKSGPRMARPWPVSQSRAPAAISVADRAGEVGWAGV
jgi:hypothetical protein